MLKYIPRAITQSISDAHKYYPVIILTGPRQTGKTTLARHMFDDYVFANLEDISVRNIALADVNGFLDNLGGKVILDEVQNYPEILSTIQARVDVNPSLRYILTGSNNFALLHHSAQSLAGRAALFTVLPFSFKELDRDELDIDTSLLMWRGFYPGTIANGIPPAMFYRNYYATYIERDVRGLTQIQNLDSFQRFIRLCAGRAGCELNKSSLGVEAGVTAPTISSWLSILEASYIVYLVQPYYANVNKRLTKTPKIYFYDTGLMCYLLGIETWQQLSVHPLRGAVFENMAMNEMIKNRYNQAKEPNVMFYRENSGKEVDMVQSEPDGLHIYEVKAGKTFLADFTANLNYLRCLLPDVKSAAIIYDGDSMGESVLNVRQL